MEIELLPGETVADVVGYEGLYKVTSYGGIWKTDSYGNAIRRLRIYRTGSSYVRTGLTKNNKRDFDYIHRIVAKAFVPNPHNLPIVNHIDGDKYNCRFDNLEWCSHYDNHQHACDTGLHPKFKLSAEDKYQICESFTSKQKTVKQLSEEYGVVQSAIRKHIKNYDRIKEHLTRK